ncbi:GPW/gp25 family protein [Humitalea sp. 24SJ18S-53]|uniref:GPW/gp25 family protein n=1 Tax=Humitalea sp. 24SJ18S-53 TaxID=3422307 RepID=UPI003D67C4B5
MHVAFPFRFDARARTAEADRASYLRGLIAQVLFTQPGERVNRPDFGSGILQLVFSPNAPEIAATAQFLVQGALQQWLGDLILVEAVEIEAEDSTLRVRIAYLDRSEQTRATADFSRGLP